LAQLGLPQIRGYVPAQNFQAAIADAIGGYLERHPDPVPFETRAPSGLADSQSLFASTPPMAPIANAQAKKAFDRVARKFDPALRDQLNRALGSAGEELIYERER
jgi:hypothetical protein